MRMWLVVCYDSGDEFACRSRPEVDAACKAATAHEVGSGNAEEQTFSVRWVDIGTLDKAKALALYEREDFVEETLGTWEVVSENGRVTWSEDPPEERDRRLSLNP